MTAGRHTRSRLAPALLAATAIAILTGLLTSAGPAAAAFPGGNGKIAYVCGPHGADICVMNEDGSGQTQLTSEGTNVEPAWSPDGSRIAFMSWRDGNWQIYVMNEDGSDQTRLTNDAAQDRWPAWSPDGMRITFTRTTGTAVDIWVMNADGSGETQLTSDGSSGGQAWSPDGSRIAFTSSRDGHDEIWVMNQDGSGQKDLTNNGSDNDAPNWSPDGQKIVFWGFASGDGIYVMNADGSDQTELIGGNVGKAVWSPDGTKIAFERVGVPFDDHVSAEIEGMNADGSGVTDLTNNPTYDDRMPDWQPLTATPGPFSDLALRIAGPRRIGPGDPITYTIRVRNTGPAAAEDVVVSDPLPAGTSFVRALSRHGSCTPPDLASGGAALTCSLGSMGDGSTRTIILVFRAPDADTTIVNTASVTSSTTDPNLHDNTATLETKVR